MYVDDEFDMTTMLKMALKRAGFTVDIFNDPLVFAGEKDIERNKGKDFDIKDIFNDRRVSMFND